MDAARVLAVNAGSSSIRFALYDMDESLRRCARGKIDRIGVSRTTLTVEGSIGARAQSYAIDVRNHDGAASALSDWLEDAGLFSAVKAVGAPRGAWHETFRTGDLDPGLVYYLARTGRMTATQFHKMVNHESGLLGVSGTSSDLRDLLAREAADVRAAEAVALFCYQAKKWIGSFAAALGGLDTLVFAGGIGENAPLIRKRICDGLGFLGVELSSKHNTKNAPLISPDAGRVKVRIIRTDEELMIARSVTRVLNLDSIRRLKP